MFGTLWNLLLLFPELKIRYSKTFVYALISQHSRDICISLALLFIHWNGLGSSRTLLLRMQSIYQQHLMDKGGSLVRDTETQDLPPVTCRIRICILRRPQGDSYAHSNLRSMPQNRNRCLTQFRLLYSELNTMDLVANKQTSVYFSRFWELRSLRSMLQQTLLRSASWFADGHLPVMFSQGRKQKESNNLLLLCKRALNAVHQESTLMT